MGSGDVTVNIVDLCTLKIVISDVCWQYVLHVDHFTHDKAQLQQIVI